MSDEMREAAREKSFEDAMAKFREHPAYLLRGQPNPRAFHDHGFDAGRAAAQGSWRAVSEGLPKETGDYLVRNQQGSCEIGYLSDVGWGKFQSEDGSVIYDVFAWMPIPEYAPPTQVDEQLITPTGEGDGEKI